MKKIDDQMLQTLFALSRFELKDNEREMWSDDLNHWIEFFSMEDIADPPNSYRPPCTGDDLVLREDKAGLSLDIKVIKSFCPRFLDGFIALPKKAGKEEFSGS